MRDRVIWGSEHGGHTLHSAGAQERHDPPCTHLREVYSSAPTDQLIHFWGRARGTPDPTASPEVDTGTTRLQSSHLGTSCFLASENFLPPVGFESMNKEGLGSCCEQRSSHSEVWTSSEPTVSTGVPWNNHHLERSFEVPTSSYCSHETPTAPKDLLAHNSHRTPVAQVYLQGGKPAAGIFHTNLCEAAITIYNSTVNPGLPAATSMRNEPTNRNLEEENKFV